MKQTIVTTSLLFSLFSFAKEQNCSYVLDQEEYWEQADGTLIIDNQTYRCETNYIGQHGDSMTLCKKKASSKSYDYVVVFDGAEANYWILDSIRFGENDDHVTCKGIAQVKS